MILQNCLTTILLVTAVSLLFDARTCYANPGVSVRITQNGFNYATEIALNKFYEDFQNAKLPDMEKNGKLYYKISNLYIASLTKPTSHVTLAPGEGLKWRVNLNRFEINGNWRFSKKVAFFKIRHSGTIEAALQNTQIEVTILPTMASNGGLNIRGTHCTCNTDLDIDVSSWFLKIILIFFKSKLERRLEERICESAISAINNKVAPKLTHYPLTETIDHDYVFDYSLESNPIINRNYLQTNHKAAIYYENGGRTIPFTPNSWPTIHDDSRMIYFIISNYLFETWLFAAHQRKILEYKALGYNANGEERLMLRTTCPGSYCIGIIIPQIAKRFPDSHINFYFSTSDRPRVYFLPNRIQIIAPTVLKFDVVQSNASIVNAFNVHVKLFIEMEAKVTDNKFFLSFTNMSFTFGNISGFFKENYNVGQLRTALKRITDSVIPFIGEIGSEGMPLILPEKTFIANPEFRVENGAIVLGADLKIEKI